MAKGQLTEWINSADMAVVPQHFFLFEPFPLTRKGKKKMKEDGCSALPTKLSIPSLYPCCARANGLSPLTCTSHIGLRGGWGAGMAKKTIKFNMYSKAQTTPLNLFKKRTHSDVSDISEPDLEPDPKQNKRITESFPTLPYSTESKNTPSHYVVMETENKKRISPFSLHKILSQKIKPTLVKNLKNETILIGVNQTSQVEEILKWKTFNNIPIKTYLHPHLNSSKGVIKCSNLSGCPLEEIQMELLDQGVTNIKRISIKKNGKYIETNTYILSFNAPSTPNQIKIGFERVNVEKYIPNPLRCFNCQKFGHHQTKCTKPPTCMNCGVDGEHTDCQEEPKCKNCNGNHAANSRNCEIWKKEKEISKIKYTKNITFPEARKLAETVKYSDMAKKTETITYKQSNQITENNQRMITENLYFLINELKNLILEIKNLIKKPTHHEPSQENVTKNEKPTGTKPETELKEKEKTQTTKTTHVNKPKIKTPTTNKSQNNERSRDKSRSTSRNRNKIESPERMDVEKKIPPDK